MKNTAVIGAGYWAKNMIRAISASSTLKTICDLDLAALETMAELYPGVSTTSDAQAVFADPTIEAVYIATPPASHFELAAGALAAGKHTLVEKPMTTTASDAEALERAARAAGVTLMVGHTFLYSPPVLKVKQLITEGALGDVCYIDSLRVNLGKHQSSGVAWDLMPHDLSILLFLLGESPSGLHASGGSFIAEKTLDVAFVTLDFPSGAMAQVQVSWLSPAKIRRMTIAGAKGMISYDDTLGSEAVRFYDSGVDVITPETFGEFQLTYRQGDILIPRLESKEPLAQEWQHFLQCIESGDQPRSDAFQGRETVRILEAIDRALETKQYQSL